MDTRSVREVRSTARMIELRIPGITQACYKTNAAGLMDIYKMYILHVSVLLQTNKGTS
jgi:hypothetical protein